MGRQAPDKPREAARKRDKDSRDERGKTTAGRSDRAHWWRRRGPKSRGFRYVDEDGNRIVDTAHLERIAKLKIPPAWTDVRISPSARNKIQAVGVDGGQRLQYIYNARFCGIRQAEKFERTARLGAALPALRQRAELDLTTEGMPRQRVLAAMIRLIDSQYFRVGSEKSVRRYKTFGVTTLRNYHVTALPDGKLLFRFHGKHHVRQRKLVDDPEIIRLLAEIRRLGDLHLFHYVDESGTPRLITARDVNDYIRSATGAEFTAKDLRTWGGSLIAAKALAEMGRPGTEKELKRNLNAATKRAAERLGNTPAVCRDSYIHPAVFARYCHGETLADFRRNGEKRALRRKGADCGIGEEELLQLLGAGNPLRKSS